MKCINIIHQGIHQHVAKIYFRSLMNCVNSISQMNSVSCEHSSLIPQEKKGPPPEQGQGGPEKRPPDEGEGRNN